MNKNLKTWTQFRARIIQMEELIGFVDTESEVISTEGSANYLVDSNIKAFSFWIAYFARFPNYDEWEAVKTFVKMNSDLNQVIRFFGRIQKEPSKEKIDLQFARGICINLQGIKLNGEVSGIPFVARQIVKKLMNENVNLSRFEVSENIEISQLRENVQNIKNENIKRKNPLKGIILSGAYASARELNYTYPSIYKSLKAIKNTGRISKIFRRQKIRQNPETIVIPINITLISITPILDEKQTALLSILSELKLIRFIPVIHDVLPLKHHGFFPFGSAEGTLSYIKLCGTSSVNFAVSKFTIAELERTYEFLGIVCPKLELLDLTELIPDRYENISKNNPDVTSQYILYISTFEPRKNHIKTVLVFEKLKKDFPNLQLILVGNYGWKNEIIHKVISNSTYSESILIKRNITEEAKYKLIQNSIATVYMSKHEGFGLPIFESIISGKQVIHDSSDPLSDFIKFGYSVIVDSDDVDSIYDGIFKVLTHEQLTSYVNLFEGRQNTFQTFVNCVTCDQIVFDK
jgi:glycosyltransferase involved in cell wall biosynthesis